MDKVTQTNAAGAEESAAAAEELNAQSVVLKDAVRELMQLVGEADNDAANPKAGQTREAVAPVSERKPHPQRRTFASVPAVPKVRNQPVIPNAGISRR